jgi:protocatechuate 3,4-dioxygenase beta subunit
MLGALFLAACGGDEDPPASQSEAAPTVGAPSDTGASTSPTAAATQLNATPACGDDDDEPTLAQTEGPYFTPNSPERRSLLETGIGGTNLIVEGLVVNTRCEPVAGALLDFWQADDAGAYDNQGYRLRGHQFADASGRYRLETVLPGIYTGRTRHIHVKVQAPNGPVLTTQLYFPGEADNARDGIYNEALLLEMGSAGATRSGTFQFVLDV